MSLQQTIEAALKDALRANDETRKTALRSVIAGIKLAKVEKQAELTDEEVLAVIGKEIKSQREAIADAEKAARADLIAPAQALMAVLESYLPRQLSREQVVAHANAAIAEAGAAGPADMGKVMKILQPKLKGLADGKVISEVVRELLAAKQPSPTPDAPPAR
ncbi:MAG TPA: GatB/YqeY domain-containing protein [Anaerolineales bacterium]|nr:GatB/YqeY domain-containing protein [Anaerolineales bacterium]